MVKRQRKTRPDTAGEESRGLTDDHPPSPILEALRHSTVGFAGCDHSAIITWANHEFAKLFFVGDERDLIGRPLLELGGDAESWNRAIDGLRNRSSADGRIELLREGVSRSIEFRFARATRSDPSTGDFFGAFFDVTELAQVKERFDRA